MWHTVVQHNKRIAMSLNANEYCILDIIAKKQQYRRAQNGVRLDLQGQQWCDVSDTTIAEILDLTRQQVSRICKKLEKSGYIQQHTIRSGHKVKKATEKYFYVMELDFTHATAKDLKPLLLDIKAEDFEKKWSKNIKTATDFVRGRQGKESTTAQQNVTRPCNKMLQGRVTKCYTNNKDIIRDNKVVEATPEKPAKPAQKNYTYPVVKSWKKFFEKVSGAPYEISWLDKKEFGAAKLLSKKFREKGFQGTPEDMGLIAESYFAKIAVLFKRGKTYCLKDTLNLMLSSLNSNYAKIQAEISKMENIKVKGDNIEKIFKNLKDI